MRCVPARPNRLGFQRSRPVALSTINLVEGIGPSNSRARWITRWEAQSLVAETAATVLHLVCEDKQRQLPAKPVRWTAQQTKISSWDKVEQKEAKALNYNSIRSKHQKTAEQVLVALLQLAKEVILRFKSACLRALFLPKASRMMPQNLTSKMSCWTRFQTILALIKASLLVNSSNQLSMEQLQKNLMMISLKEARVAVVLMEKISLAQGPYLVKLALTLVKK